MISIKTIVDLSHDLNNATAVYPGDPVPDITVATTIAQHGYNLFNVSLGSQSGSHVDAPYHFSSTGRTVDKIGLELCMGRACVVDVSFKKAGEPITVKDIEPYTGQIEAADVVLFRTDWYKKAGQPDFLNHPYLSEEGGHFLQANGIQTIGIDAMLMPPDKKSFPFTICTQRQGDLSPRTWPILIKSGLIIHFLYRSL